MDEVCSSRAVKVTSWRGTNSSQPSLYTMPGASPEALTFGINLSEQVQRKIYIQSRRACRTAGEALTRASPWHDQTLEISCWRRGEGEWRPRNRGRRLRVY